MTGSNRRPSACKADALPAELIPLCLSHECPRNTALSNPRVKNYTFVAESGGSGWTRTIDPRLIKTVL